MLQRYQCLGCDGYEQSGTPIGILDFSSPMAAHFVGMALNFDPRVTIFSNGPISQDRTIQSALQTATALGATVDTRKISRLINNGDGDADGIIIEFETGPSVTLGFLVHKPPTVNRAADLVEQLGLETVDESLGGHVKVFDYFNETSLKGCFAAGDTMVMMKQVTVAMAEGVKAGAGVLKQIGEERAGEARRRVGLGMVEM